MRISAYKLIVWAFLLLALAGEASAVMRPDSQPGLTNHLSPSQLDPNKQSGLILKFVDELHYPASVEQIFVPNHIFQRGSNHQKGEFLVSAFFYQFLAQTPEKWRPGFLEMFFGEAGKSKFVEVYDPSVSSLPPQLAGQSTLGVTVVLPVIKGLNNYRIAEDKRLENLPVIQKFFRLKAIYKANIYLQVMEKVGAENFWLHFAAAEIVAEGSFAVFSSSLVKALKPYREIFELEVDHQSFPQEFLFELIFHFRDLIESELDTFTTSFDDYLDDRFREGALGAYNGRSELLVEFKNKILKEPTAGASLYNQIKVWRAAEFKKQIASLEDTSLLISFLSETIRNSQLRRDFLTQFVAIDEVNALSSRDPNFLRLVFQKAQEQKKIGDKNYLKDLLAYTAVAECGQLLAGHQ